LWQDEQTWPNQPTVLQVKEDHVEVKKSVQVQMAIKEDTIIDRIIER
jgi:hypothetical protein